MMSPATAEMPVGASGCHSGFSKPSLVHGAATSCAQMAARFLQQKRLVALQGLELTPLT